MGAKKNQRYIGFSIVSGRVVTGFQCTWLRVMMIQTSTLKVLTLILHQTSALFVLNEILRITWYMISTSSTDHDGAIHRPTHLSRRDFPDWFLRDLCGLLPVFQWLHLVDPHQPVLCCVRFLEVLQIKVLVANLHIPGAIKARRRTEIQLSNQASEVGLSW